MYNSNTDIWLAGAMAAFTVDFIVYPLDTLKTRIQSSRYKSVYTDAATGAIRRGVLFKGLYQGIWSVVIATIPSSGAFFTTYEGIKYTLTAASKSSDHPEKNLLPFRHSLPIPVVHGIASSAAECVSCLILTPAEVLKQNAQMVTMSNNDNSNSNSSTQTSGKGKNVSATKRALSQFRSHPTHLWRGYGALVARNLPFTAMHFPLFEHLREIITFHWRNRQQKTQKGGQQTSGGQEETIFERAVITAMSAGISGAFAATVTTPIDVVKTRIMLAAGKDNALKTASGKRTSSLAVGYEIYKKEGLKGLFRGGALRGGWTALGIGLYLSAYESGRMFLEKRREHRMEAYS